MFEVVEVFFKETNGLLFCVGVSDQDGNPLRYVTEISFGVSGGYLVQFVVEEDDEGKPTIVNDNGDPVLTDKQPVEMFLFRLKKEEDR